MDDSRRFSEITQVDISESYNAERVLDREAFTADFDELDLQLAKLLTFQRPERDGGPMNEAVWNHVRNQLALAKPGYGLTDTDTPNNFEIRSMEQVLETSGYAAHYIHLTPINAVAVAEKIQLPLRAVLTELLYATAAGVLEMIWSAQCQRCGAGTTQEHTLTDIKNESQCALCHYHSKIDALDRIKVVFRLSNTVFNFPCENFECLHHPEQERMKRYLIFLMACPTLNDSGYSFLFGVKDNNASQSALAKGRYRIHCAYSGVDCILEVQRDATDNDTLLRRKLVVSEMRRPVGAAQGKVFTVDHGKLRFDVVCDTGSFAVLFFFNDNDPLDDDTFFRYPEELGMPKFTTATDCIHTPCFQDLFGNQIVSESSRFTMKRVVLVFTDVVSSTAMYQDCGDGKALDVVRLHFKILFSAFAKYGRIVKTVGDAVMGAFTCGEAAIRAVAMSLDAMQGKVLRPCGSQLSIRVGIHAGPVLMVPLNGINDYFGQTVNIAARVESKAGDGECLVSEAVLQESTAKAALDELYERGYGHTRDVDLVLKGVEGKVHAKGFQSRLAT